MNLKEKRGKQIMDDIRQVLYNEWDPYCVKGEAPEDEYDFCISPIYRLLTQNPTAEKIVDCLVKLGCEAFGTELESVAPEDIRHRKDRLIKVANKLLEIDISIPQ